MAKIDKQTGQADTAASKKTAKRDVDTVALSIDTNALANQNHKILLEILKITKHMKWMQVARFIAVVIFLVVPLIISIIALPWIMDSFQPIFDMYSGVLGTTGSDSGTFMDLYTQTPH
ncbi:MAG: hypothetical protein ABIG66_05410 [Candidatus Kerfeldbacteria bacterium]